MWGSLPFPQLGDPERESPRVDITATTEPPKAAESGSWAGPARPAPTAHVAGDTSPRYKRAGGTGRRLFCGLLEPLPGASSSAWLGTLEGKAGTPPSPRGLETPPRLAPAGEPDSGEGVPPAPGCSRGPQEGSQATEQPLRSCLRHPHQRRTLGSRSRRRKTGKYSDQREGITVQKKRVQPERAPARPEPRVPQPRRLRPCPARWQRYRSGHGLAWGAVSQGTCLKGPHIRLSPRGNQLQAQGRWPATVPDSKRLPHRTGRQHRGPLCQ